jgi:ferredoxin
MAKIRIVAARCQKCGRCVDICPQGLFVQQKPLSVPRIPRQRACIDCGHCVSICPASAIQHVNFPVEVPVQDRREE